MVNVRQKIIITLKNKLCFEAFYKHSGTVLTFKVRLNHFGYIFVQMLICLCPPSAHWLWLTCSPYWPSASLAERNQVKNSFHCWCELSKNEQVTHSHMADGCKFGQWYYRLFQFILSAGNKHKTEINRQYKLHKSNPLSSNHYYV